MLSFGTKGNLHTCTHPPSVLSVCLDPLPTLQNNQPVPQVLKQVVNLSCSLWSFDFKLFRLKILFWCLPIGRKYPKIFNFRTPSGLEDVSKYPALFASLLASGAWSLEDLKKLAGLNFLRVFREVEKVSYFFCNECNMASSCTQWLYFFDS